MSEVKLYRVVCAKASDPEVFHDDCFGECVECGVMVRFRPHVPAPRELVCLTCFMDLYMFEEDVLISKRTIEELLETLKTRVH